MEFGVAEISVMQQMSMFIWFMILQTLLSRRAWIILHSDVIKVVKGMCVPRAEIHAARTCVPASGGAMLPDFGRHVFNWCATLVDVQPSFFFLTL
jgi:hypothetical protein